MSKARMNRYLKACDNNTQKTMTLYRWNLKLAQELFTVISCFEIALRNAINDHHLNTLGSEWLKLGASKGGIFDNSRCRNTRININNAINKLNTHYTHDKLVAELGFGFWRYMFAPHQFFATGQTLLQIFPAKPTSTPNVQYNQSFVFNQLARINQLRNRIAHHEPICFQPNQSTIDTKYVQQHYSIIVQLFQWMNIDEKDFLYGLDHINKVCTKIDGLN